MRPFLGGEYLSVEIESHKKTITKNSDIWCLAGYD